MQAADADAAADAALAAELGLDLAPRVIDAEILPRRAEPKRKTTKTLVARPVTARTTALEAKAIKRRDRVYTDVALYDHKSRTYSRKRLSERERKLVGYVLKGMTISKAAEEVGIAPRTAHRYLARPFIRNYMDEMRDRAAQAADLTQEKVARVLSKAADGAPDVMPGQVVAAIAAARYLGPNAGRGGTSITVNQQNNYHAAPSPFTGQDQAQMLEAIKANLLEVDTAGDPVKLEDEDPS